MITKSRVGTSLLQLNLISELLAALSELPPLNSPRLPYILLNPACDDIREDCKGLNIRVYSFKH